MDRRRLTLFLIEYALHVLSLALGRKDTLKFGLRLFYPHPPLKKKQDKRKQTNTAKSQTLILVLKLFSKFSIVIDCLISAAGMQFIKQYVLLSLFLLLYKYLASLLCNTNND